MKRPVIVDMPDTAGAFYALAWIARVFDLKGVTASQGASAARIAGMCRLLGLDCPVTAGAARPIIRTPGAPDRGRAGEGAHRLGAFIQGEVSPGYAWDFLMRQAKRLNGALEVITLGSLTNLAIASARYPELGGLIKRVTLYAGARLAGNVPAAPQSEWNLYNDPEAGHMAMRLDSPKLVVDLNTALEARFDAQRLTPLLPEAALAAVCVQPDAPLPIPELACAAFALEVTLDADARDLAVTVETDSDLTRGKLVIEHDTAGKGDTPNCRLIFAHDAAALAERVYANV